MRYCVIIAGGAGSRIWPMSRKRMPKQFLDVLGCGSSLLRQTFDRYSKMFDVENFLVVTHVRYRDLVLEQLPELNPNQVLCEPIGRNTAPAITYATHHIHRIDSEAQMVVTPADHYVGDDLGLLLSIEKSLSFASKHNTLVAVGVRPSHPETAYGYIQRSDEKSISKVKSFSEKPNIELAQTFMQCGEFFWNTGIFVGCASQFIKSLREQLPELESLFSSISESFATPQESDAIDSIYSDCNAISFDNGVMERADNIHICVGEFAWSDVGTWSSLYQHSSKDRDRNTTADNILLYDTTNSVISIPKDKVAVISGLNDYVVVDNGDVLMICPRSEESSIKKYADEVRFVRDKRRGGGL